MNDWHCIASALMLMETLCKRMAYRGSPIPFTSLRHWAPCGQRIETWHALERRSGATDAIMSILWTKSRVDHHERGFQLILSLRVQALNDRQLKDEWTIRRIKTARNSLEVLSYWSPMSSASTRTPPLRSLVETLCGAVPNLIKEDRNSAKKECEAPIAALMTCLVATSAIASKDILAGSKDQRGPRRLLPSWSPPCGTFRAITGSTGTGVSCSSASAGTSRRESASGWRSSLLWEVVWHRRALTQTLRTLATESSKSNYMLLTISSTIITTSTTGFATIEQELQNEVESRSEQNFCQRLRNRKIGKAKDEGIPYYTKNLSTPTRMTKFMSMFILLGALSRPNRFLWYNTSILCY